MITTNAGHTKWVRKAVVLAACEISNSTLSRWIEHRGFPRPRYITLHRPMWNMGAVQAWLDAQLDADVTSDGGEA